jgi:hypothetical protein
MGRRVQKKLTYLEEGILLLRLELVGPEEFKTALCLLRRETVLVALEELEDILHDDRLEVNLFLVVEILGL